MNNKIYTIACKQLVDLVAGSLSETVFINGQAVNSQSVMGGGMAGLDTKWGQGDITFTPSDPVLSGDPSITITYRSKGLSNNYPPSTSTVFAESAGCPQIPGNTQTPGAECNFRITKYKFPTDLNNITVQYYTDRFTDNPAVESSNKTPAPTHALVKDVVNDRIYGVSQRHRFLVDNTTLAFTSPVQILVRLYDASGIGSLSSWDDGYAPGYSNYTGQIHQSGQFDHSGNFMGGAQSPSCTERTGYTYDCGTEGCVSVYGTGGDYTYLSACTAACISYSCITSCICPSGSTTQNADFTAIVAAATMQSGSIYDFKDDTNVVAQNVDTTDSCAWRVPFTMMNTQGSTYLQPLEFVTSGFQNSQWGSDGTRFCLNNDCSSYHDLTGPSTGVGSGFWGQTGNYLFNARLNTVGAWPGGIPLANTMWTTQTAWMYAGQTQYGNSTGNPALGDGRSGKHWVGVSRCVTVTGQTDQAFLIGIASADYYRIGVDGVSVINTMQRELSEIKTFNPAGFASFPATAYEQATMSPINQTNTRWWVHRIVLTPGEHSITLEGTANPWVLSDKIFGCDILGPYNLTEYTTPAQVALMTPQIYTADTIFSTAELNENVSTYILSQQNTLCLMHDTVGPCPYPAGGQLMYQYPDNYMIAWGVGGPTGWVGGGTGQVTILPNGGIVNDSTVGRVNWDLNCLPYMAPKTNGVQVYHSNGQNLGEMNIKYMPYATELPTTVGLSTAGFQAFSPSISGGYACESPVPSMVTGGITYKKPGEGPRILGITPQINLNQAPTQTWRELIDYLNAQGLYVSSVADPGTTNYPNIDYNATFWQVVYAMKDYWTATHPNGAPNGQNPGGQSTHTYNGGNSGVYLDSGCYNWCACEDSPGIFDTQVTSCDLMVQENIYYALYGGPTGLSGLHYYNAVTSSLLGGVGSPCGADCGRDWIYDACYGACVATTGCTDQTDSVNFTGGCTPIPGTGYSQSDVFDTLIDCELSCSTSASTGGTIYYLCGDSGCTTASTVTPFTTLAQCTGSCISHECTDTGCTEFNPPASTANIGLSPDYYGSGGTYTNPSACWADCISWDCANWGCEQYGLNANLGTGGTYTTELACTADCASWECLDNGCIRYDGSGYTFSSETLCTNVCRSYECTTNCCELYNVPFYGTGGTYYDQTSSGASASACTGDCASWGCNSQVVASGTNIYTFYDNAYVDINTIKNHILAMSAWTQSLYGNTGNSYSVIVNDNRWLSWASSVYTGAFSGGASTTALNNFAGQVHQWAVNLGIDSNIYDNCNAGASFSPLVSNSGNIILAKGPAPVSTAADDVLVITCLNTATGYPTMTTNCLYHTPVSVWGNTLQFYPQYSGGNSSYSCEYQPSDTWKDDYDGFSYYHSQMLVGGGSFNGFVYPYGGCNPLNVHPQPGHCEQAQRVFPLSIVASIDLGNKTAQDGTWSTGTAPRMSNNGGILGGTPGLCGRANLEALELQENPYYTEGYGSLSTKGWGYNIEYPTQPSTWSSTYHNMSGEFLIDRLNIFLTSGITSTTGCISACTIPSTFYPYSSQTACESGETSCQYYDCTNTGCQLTSPFGTIGTYTTLTDCEAQCTSWNCNNFTGITAIQGPCTPQTGTGGTFTNSVDCTNLCNSYQCYGLDPTLPQPLWGCLSTLGTGNTFSTYSACTADCRSWECATPCSAATSGGCIEYPYSGMSYSAESACTASCIANWWCVPETNADSCSGRTLILQVASQPPANSSLGPFGMGSIADIIANALHGHQFTNLSQIRYLDIYLTSLFAPGGVINPAYADTCMEPWGWCGLGGTCDYFVMYPVRIESDLLPGGPWYVYNDFILSAQATGIIMPNGNLVSLTDLWPDVRDAISNFYQAPVSMNYTRVITDKCICTGVECSVECLNTGTPPNPTWTGPYPTSGDAYTVCCAHTWECTEGYSVDSCSGRTNVSVGTQFNSSVDAFNYVSINYPNLDINTLSYESDISPSSLTEPCIGPSGGALMKYDPYDYTLLNNGISYSTWDYFIHDLQQQGLSQVASGMSYDLVSTYLHEISGNTLSICTAPCRCIEVDCSCYEIEGSGGTYTSEAACLTALTAGVASCICPEVTGTSWNCYNNGPFEPTCNRKVDIGTLQHEHSVVDWFRVNAPSQLFDSKKFNNTHHIMGGTLNQFPIPSLTYAQMWANMGPTPYAWEDCYRFYSGATVGAPQTWYRPYLHLMYIQHQFLSGGAGQWNQQLGVWEYTNWNDFYNTAVAAGVSLTSTMSFSSACETITAFYNPTSLNFECGTRVEQCCSGEDCYCLQQYTTGGTYSTEALCITACCDTVSGYTCQPILGCIPAGPNVSPYWGGSTALADCNACIINPLCPSGQTCQDITWDCNSGFTTNSCGDAQGPIDQISPGTTGQATGAPFITNPPTYPFSSDSLTIGYMNGFGHSETIFTDYNYWDPMVNFDIATYEIDNPAYLNGTLSLPADICMGPNGFPEFRLISIGHDGINNATQYTNWSSFVAVASAVTGVYLSTMTSIQNTVGLHPAGWLFTIEPCICISSGCTCYPVIGTTGQYLTSAACEYDCCEIPETYNCVAQLGCVDPLTGLGNFTGQTAHQDCLDVCYEWRCNNAQVPSDCDCIIVPGTGNTGTVYSGSQLGYYSCITACCETVIIPDCPILLGVGSIMQPLDAGVFLYDITTNSGIKLLQDWNFTEQDISYWKNGNDYHVFIYNNNLINEWIITSGVAPLLVRQIQLTTTIGKGLTNIDLLTLVSGGNTINRIDLINPTSTTANITPIFSLPQGYSVTGDIAYDSTTNLFLILYSKWMGLAGVYDWRLGKFAYNGTLIEDITIPPGLLLNGTCGQDMFDGIICNTTIQGPPTQYPIHYIITTHGYLFQIIETPTLSISLTPLHPTSALASIGNINAVTGAAGKCGCKISIPETYICEIDPGTGLGTCIDPGTGLGQYTWITALANSFLTPWDECNAHCQGQQTSWKCIPAVYLIDTCDTVTIHLPYPAVNYSMGALEYIVNNNITNNFTDISFEVTNMTPLPNSCLGPNGFVENQITYVYCAQCPVPALNLHYYNWPDYITALQAAGIAVTVNTLLSDVIQAVSGQYNLTQGVMSINTHPCVCIGEPCDCIEINGTAGYPTSADCMTNCCEDDVRCQTVVLVPTCDVPSGLPGTTICCATINNQVPTQQDLNKIVHYNNHYFKIKDIYLCEPSMFCPNNACTTIDNLTLTTCDPVIDTTKAQGTTSGYCLKELCEADKKWDYNTCACIDQNTNILTTFKGDETHLSVMISDYTSKDLKQVTEMLSLRIQSIDSQIKHDRFSNSNCDGQYSSGLFSGCIKYIENNIYTWKSQISDTTTTYSCFDGVCVEYYDDRGSFNTMLECIKACDSIIGKGTKPTIRNLSIGTQEDLNTPICLPDSSPSITTTTPLSTTSIVKNYYKCETRLNKLVGENQKACVPLDGYVTGSFSSLEDCINSGCAGWMNCKTTSTVDGVGMKSSQTAPIVMCCETYIAKATKPITTTDCTNNCCDGTDIWFPTYNVIGVNTTLENSSLGYLQRQLSSLINSKLCTVSEKISTYTKQGKTTIKSYGKLQSCEGQVEGYIDGKPCFPTIAEALKQSKVEHCSGYHQHYLGDTICYMACEEHSLGSNAKAGPDTGIACCVALNCPAKGKGCECKRTTVMGSGVVNCHCEGNCGGNQMVGIPYVPTSSY